MSRTSLIIRLAIAGCAVTLAAGCGGDSDESNGLGGIPGGALQGAGTDNGTDDASDDCSLLTDDDVAAAIGDHNSGEQDFVYGGCVWHTSDDGTGAARSAIHVAVVPSDQYRQLADANTRPVTDFAPNATYSDTQGELWWPCQTDQYCLVKVDIADPTERQDVAQQLGQIVRDKN